MNWSGLQSRGDTEHAGAQHVLTPPLPEAKEGEGLVVDRSVKELFVIDIVPVLGIAELFVEVRCVVATECFSEPAR